MIWMADVIVRSSLIIVIGLLLLRLLRHRSAALRHWLLFTTLICAAFVPAAETLLPEWSPLKVPPAVPQLWAERIPTAMLAVAPPASGTTARSVALVQHKTERSLDGTLRWVWGVGTVLSLAALIIGLLRLRYVEATSTPLRGGQWADALARRRLPNMPSRVEVRATRRPGLLLVWGVARPTIIVPSAAEEWPALRISAVLDHELAHIRRQDWLMQIVAEAVRAVYWFNPLVWIACARLRAECEIACDDMVIANGTGGAEYATHVVEIARELRTQFWLPAPAIARPSTLERRVKAMLDKTLDRRPLSPRLRGAAVAVVTALTLAIAAVAAQSFVSLSGTIVDPSNGVLPGVKLILTNEQTQAKYEIQTDRTGRYEFVGLPPGNYTMDAALPGFTRIAGRVTVGTQNLQQDLTMAIGMLQETVTVRQDAVQPAMSPERQRKLEEAKQKRAQQTIAAAARCSDSSASTEVRMGGNLRVPIKLRDVWPQYPASLRGTEGNVVLNARIGTTGAVDEVDVVSSTHPEFTQSAIEAVRQWEFDATLLNCEPIATPMQVTVNYKTR